MQKSFTLRKIIQTSLIIAITLVLRNFSHMFYFGGGAGMRIGISTFFSKLPALLFGPLYGGISDGLTDILAYILKPEGAYMPLLTLTAILGGVIVGFMWKKIKNINTKKFAAAFAIVFAVIGLIGSVNWIFATMAPMSEYGKWLMEFKKKISFFTVWPTLTALVALVIFAFDAVLRKKSGMPNDFIKLFTVLITANLIVTTINTFILMIFIPATGSNGFLAFYIPRFIEECIVTTLQSYVVSYLLKIYRMIYPEKTKIDFD